MRIFILYSFLFFNSAFASIDYIEASFSEKIDYNNTTVIFIVGKSGNLGNASYASAYTRAKIIESIMPEVQIVFYRVREYSLEKEKSELKIGIDTKVLDINNKQLNGEELIFYLDKFKSIKAIHFYGHSSPWYMKTESGTISNKIALRNGDVLNHRDRNGKKQLEQLEWAQPNVDLLRDNFDTDAFVTINGCNSGYYFAPELSRKWKIPVLAALTGTVFQRLHKNNKWYQFQKSFGYYPDANWAKEMQISEDVTVKCPTLGCFRMKPDTVGYKGYWGDFRKGYLPYYKAFCNIEDNDELNNKLCRSAMLSNLSTTASTGSHYVDLGIDDFITKVADSLCINTDNVSHVKNNFDYCLAEVQSIMQSLFQEEDLNRFVDVITYNPVATKLLKCNHRRCDFIDMKCNWRSDGEATEKSCTLVVDSNSNGYYVFGNELIEYVKAYKESL